MLAIDLRHGQLLTNDQIHDELKARFPYKKWLKEGVRYLDSELVDTHTAAEPMDAHTLVSYQKMVFQWSAVNKHHDSWAHASTLVEEIVSQRTPLCG